MSLVRQTDAQKHLVVEDAWCTLGEKFLYIFWLQLTSHNTLPAMQAVELDLSLRLRPPGGESDRAVASFFAPHQQS